MKRVRGLRQSSGSANPFKDSAGTTQSYVKTKLNTRYFLNIIIYNIIFIKRLNFVKNFSNILVI